MINSARGSLVTAKNGGVMQRSFWAIVSICSLLLAPCSFADYSIRPPVGEPGPDLSARFSDLMAQKPVIRRGALQGYRILIVPGIFADPIGANMGYFSDEIGALKEAGLQEGVDFRKVGRAEGFSGEASVEENGRAIARAIQASDRPVLLITHSKGTADALDALLEHPDLQARVRGWFSIQGAVWGSPIADTVSGSWERLLLGRALRWYGGSPRALTDLRRPFRHSYMVAHQAGIASLIRAIPTVTFASWKLYSGMAWVLRQIDLFYYPDYPRNISDGMIEIDDALIPGAPYILVSGVDHDDTTMSAPSTFDRRSFIGVILSLFLRRRAQINAPLGIPSLASFEFASVGKYSK